jgi:hypothetical protein
LSGTLTDLFHDSEARSSNFPGVFQRCGI